MPAKARVIATGNRSGVHAIHAAPKCQLAAVSQVDLPPGQLAGAAVGTADAELHGDGIELVGLHPVDDCGDEFLKEHGEILSAENVAGMRCQHAIGDAAELFAGDAGDALPCFCGRHIAPTSSLGRQFFVKLPEHFVHESAGLACVHFEAIAFAGAETRVGEELKRTRCELFQSTRGSAQAIAVELGCRLG